MEKCFDGFLLNEDLKITQCGDFAKRVLKLDPNDFTEKSIFDFIPKSEQSSAKRKIKSILKGKKTYFDLLCGMREKNGVERYIQMEFLPDINNNKIDGIVVKLVDATNYKRVENTLLQVEERYKIFFENGSDAVFVYQISNSKIPGKFIEFNTVLTDYTGLEKQQLFQSSIIDIISRENYDLVMSKMDQLLKNGKVRFESEIKNVNGTKIPVEINSTLVNYNNQKTILNIARNIKQRKEAEEKLRTNYEILKTTLDETVNALSAIAEVRDPYTAGHQLRVANLAVLIAQRMELDEDKIKGLKVAGVLHDIGKVSIPSEILTKPGKLTKLEFELIKTHSQIGYEILKQIPFPWPIDKIVHQHHERLDGKGYPQGLKDKEIIVEAKILAVADTVEAMSSHRPYRAALGLKLGLEEITINSGKKYDNDVVQACRDVFYKDKLKVSELG